MARRKSWILKCLRVITLVPHVNPGREPRATCLSEEFFNVVLMCVAVKNLHNVLDEQRAMLWVSIRHCVCGTEYNVSYLDIVDQKRIRDETCFIKSQLDQNSQNRGIHSPAVHDKSEIKSFSLCTLWKTSASRSSSSSWSASWGCVEPSTCIPVASLGTDPGPSMTRTEPSVTTSGRD